MRTVPFDVGGIHVDRYGFTLAIATIGQEERQIHTGVPVARHCEGIGGGRRVLEGVVGFFRGSNSPWSRDEVVSFGSRR
jgi:hypothetical protein